MHLRRCLLEGGWAEGIADAPNFQLRPPQEPGLVSLDNGGTAVLDRCSFLWHGQRIAKGPPHLTCPFSELTPQEAKDRAKGQGWASSAPFSKAGPVHVTVVLAETGSRAQLSRCEVNAAEGCSHAGSMVCGLSSNSGSAVLATRCSLTGCHVLLGKGSSLVGSHLRLSASSMGRAEAEAGGGSPASVLFGVGLQPSSTCKLVQCHISGFQRALSVSRDDWRGMGRQASMLRLP